MHTPSDPSQNLPAVITDGTSLVETHRETYNKLTLVTPEVYKAISSASDSWTDIVSLIRPSQINQYSSSAHQNLELEGACTAIWLFCRLWGDVFQEVDTKQVSLNGIPLSEHVGRLENLEEWGYIKKVWGVSGTIMPDSVYLVTNKFIKAFLRDGIFDLEKAKQRELKEQADQLIYDKQNEVKRRLYDTMMIVYIYLHDISDAQILNYDALRSFIEIKTDGVLTLGIFEIQGRGTSDIFIQVKGVTFELDPFLTNISIGYMNWRSVISDEDALRNFVSWITDTPQGQFEEDVKRSLQIR